MTRKIACITVDVEADFLDPTGRIRLFEDGALLERFTSIIQASGAKVTAFLVTSLLPKHGAAYRRLSAQIPLEFALHSHAHDMQNPCSRQDIQPHCWTCITIPKKRHAGPCGNCFQDLIT